MKNNRSKRSIIWKISNEDFCQLIKNSKTYSEVFKYFQMKNKGGNSKTLKNRIELLNLDCSHFLKRSDSSQLSRRMTKEVFKEDWLTKDSQKQRVHIKNYLIKFEMIPYECEKCKNKGIWNGSKLSLQLEHRNGVSDDNRFENLCFLCPNCHSQTETFSGKRNKIIKHCKCGVQIWKKSLACNKCSIKRKINWPTKEFFEKELWKRPTILIAKHLGVSDIAIAKHINKLGLTKPPRGFWTKK